MPSKQLGHVRTVTRHLTFSDGPGCKSSDIIIAAPLIASMGMDNYG